MDNVRGIFKALDPFTSSSPQHEGGSQPGGGGGRSAHGSAQQHGGIPRVPGEAPLLNKSSLPIDKGIDLHKVPSGQAPDSHKHPAGDASKAMGVRLLWCDTAGIRRCRVIPGRQYARALGRGVGITAACMVMPAYADQPVVGSGLSAVGESRMVPIESTRVALPWAPGHHMALVEFDAPKSEGPWDCCPRRALRNCAKMLEENFGFTMKVGFEIEFLLLEKVPPGGGAATAGGGGGGLHGTCWRPVDSSLYCQSSAMDRQARVLDEVVSAMEAMGIPVEQWHPESAPGQFEIVLEYCDVVEAADRLLLAKEALVGVANCYGLAVSFLPKPVRTAAGNGCHAHISLWKAGVSRMAVTSGGSFSAAAACITAAATAAAATAAAAPSAAAVQSAAAAAAAATVAADAAADASTSSKQHKAHQQLQQHRSEEGTNDGPLGPLAKAGPITPSIEMLSFLAGLLGHLDLLLPFTSPAPASFARLMPGAWAGAHMAWGYNNREVPLRVTAPGPSRLLEMHLEYKPMDCTANPYMALSAIMVAGMLGLFGRMVPPEPCQVLPADLDDEAKARLHVRPLPSSLDEALDLIQTSRGEAFRAAMTEAIGAPLLQAFLAVRAAEAKRAQHDLPGDLLLRYS